MKKTVFIISLLTVFISCKKENKEAIKSKSVDDIKNTTSDCDTANVSYSATVSPIMLRSCSTVGCHVGSSPASGILLDNYSDVKTYADNGSLMGTIKHNSAYSAMPKGADKLSDCEIAKLDAWINAGSSNN